MKKRILLLTTLAAMLAAAMALSGVAWAAPVGDAADRQCLNLARQTLGGFGQNFKPADYTFIGGTEGNDDFSGEATEGRDVFCGFGGVDEINTLDEGDVFLGGEGATDAVGLNFGTFYGGEGDDIVGLNEGTFYGGLGGDFVSDNFGTFYGDEGNDSVLRNESGGTFYGGEGNDEVVENSGTFYGGQGNDFVFRNFGTFYGGEGNDFVSDNFGTFIQD